MKTLDIDGHFFTKDTDFGDLSNPLSVTIADYGEVGTATVGADDSGLLVDMTFDMQKMPIEFASSVDTLMKGGHLFAVSCASESEIDSNGEIKTWVLSGVILMPTPTDLRE